MVAMTVSSAAFFLFSVMWAGSCRICESISAYISLRLGAPGFFGDLTDVGVLVNLYPLVEHPAGLQYYSEGESAAAQLRSLLLPTRGHQYCHPLVSPISPFLSRALHQKTRSYT